jgi:hypothetical protein
MRFSNFLEGEVSDRQAFVHGIHNVDASSRGMVRSQLTKAQLAYVSALLAMRMLFPKQGTSIPFASVSKIPEDTLQSKGSFLEGLPGEPARAWQMYLLEMYKNSVGMR